MSDGNTSRKISRFCNSSELLGLFVLVESLSTIRMFMPHILLELLASGAFWADICRQGKRMHGSDITSRSAMSSLPSFTRPSPVGFYISDPMSARYRLRYSPLKLGLTVLRATTRDSFVSGCSFSIPDSSIPAYHASSILRCREK